jgi:hypothetical protein
MIRIWPVLPLAFAAFAALMLAGSTSSATTAPTLIGSSGKRGAPVITFKDANGMTIKSLRAGRYKLVIRDYSRFRDFHLKGPKLNVYSTLPFVGRLSYGTLVFGKGKYSFWCDAHKSATRRSFTVV